MLQKLEILAVTRFLESRTPLNATELMWKLWSFSGWVAETCVTCVALREAPEGSQFPNVAVSDTDCRVT
jgi:hypothetical protein